MARMSDVLTFRTSFHVPDRSGEMTLSIQGHLLGERKSLIMCQIDSDKHVDLVYSKLCKAFYFMKHASIVNCADKKCRHQKLYQENSIMVNKYCLLYCFEKFIYVYFGRNIQISS